MTSEYADLLNSLFAPDTLLPSQMITPVGLSPEQRLAYAVLEIVMKDLRLGSQRLWEVRELSDEQRAQYVRQGLSHNCSRSWLRYYHDALDWVNAPETEREYSVETICQAFPTFGFAPDMLRNGLRRLAEPAPALTVKMARRSPASVSSGHRITTVNYQKRTAA